MKHYYGSCRTHLALNGKALKAYNEIDPMLIEEIETHDGYRYNITGTTEAENLTEDELIRGLEDLYDELLIDGGILPHIWYAVVYDREDTDLGTGSFNKDTAIQMVKELRQDFPEAYIVVVDDDHDVCIAEITEFATT